MKRQFNSGAYQSIVENTVVRGLRYNPGISLDWTSEELSALEYLTQKYASDVPIVRYAGIAQALPRKNIRDVVFVIKWMKEKKSRKIEDVSRTDIFSYEPIIGNNGVMLVEHNARVLDQIEANLLDMKIEENMNLLSEARDNIISILSVLPNTFQDRMPPFPFKLNQQLAHTVLPPKYHPGN